MSNLTPWQTSDVPVIETNFYHAVIKLQNDPFHPQAKGTTIGYVHFFGVMCLNIFPICSKNIQKTGTLKLFSSRYSNVVLNEEHIHRLEFGPAFRESSELFHMVNNEPNQHLFSALAMKMTNFYTSSVSKSDHMKQKPVSSKYLPWLLNYLLFQTLFEPHLEAAFDVSRFPYDSPSDAPRVTETLQISGDTGGTNTYDSKVVAYASIWQPSSGG